LVIGIYTDFLCSNAKIQTKCKKIEAFNMEIQQFKAKLVKPNAAGAWTYLTVPFKADDVYASRARIPVKGTINNIPYRGSLLPHGDGRHYMVVNKGLRDSCGVSNGDQVEVTMQLDEDVRRINGYARSTFNKDGAFVRKYKISIMRNLCFLIF
jgi:hypothetical protein